MKKTEKGFTLIELLVSIAIFSVVIASLFTFMVMISRTYNNNLQEVSLQNESQTVLTQIDNLVVNADAGVKQTGNQVYIVSQDAAYVIRFATSEGKLYLSENKSPGFTAGSTNDQMLAAAMESGFSYSEEGLLAEYVSSFSVVPHFDDKDNNYVEVFLTLQYPNSTRSYSVSQNMFLRNRIYEKAATD